MGSTKHIRNNGEHLNIHGHDNYQMPGAYKQMGDMNQNQPGKISGGASRYIKEALGVGKITDPETAAEKAARLAKAEKDQKLKNSTTGDVSFKIDDSGATLSKSKTTTSSTPSSSSSSSSSKPIVDKGEDAFYANLTSSAKDMSAMTAAGIDVNDRKAVLNYGNTKAKNMKSSSSSSASTSTNTSSSSENNPVTIKSINNASNYAMQSMLGDKNRDVYATEMQAKKDSTSAYQKTFKNLVEANPQAGLGKKVLGDFHNIAGRSGSDAANVTRKNDGVPEVENDFNKDKHHITRKGGGGRSYNNTLMGSGSKLTNTSPQIDINKVVGTKYSRSTPIYADFNSLYGPKNEGPNKGIHSSKGKGINKILKQYK